MLFVSLRIAGKSTVVVTLQQHTCVRNAFLLPPGTPSHRQLAQQGQLAPTDCHAALVEVEQHVDAVALLLCGLHSLPAAPAGQALPIGRGEEAVAAHILRVHPPSSSQPGRITPRCIYLPCITVNAAKRRPDRIATLLAAARVPP